jgi:CheY-like chemotaxis protein
MRRLLVWSLQQADYEVIECKDGMSLMKKLGLMGTLQEPQTIDLVISDIRMPGVTGLQVLEYAQEMQNAPPVILISAFADEDAFERARRLGAATLLPKPFDMEDLFAKVQEYVPPPDMKTVPDNGNQVSEADLPFTLEVTFRHGSSSEPVKECIQRLAQKMARFGEHILHCRVVLDVGNQSESARKGPHVALVISTPGRPLIVEHEASAGSGDENLYLALHRVFSTAYRQLKQKHQMRKSHRDRKHQARRENHLGCALADKSAPGSEPGHGRRSQP